MANILRLLKQAALEWKRHNPLFMGAAISFYVILSMGPILVLLLFLVSNIFQGNNASAELVQNLEGIVGPKAAGVIQTIMERASTASGRTITLLASIPLIFFGSTMIFFQLKYALNIVFGYEKKGRDSLKKKIKSYSFSFIMLAVLGLVFFLLIIKNPLLALLKDQINEVIPLPWLAFRIIEIIFTFSLLVFVFMMIYLVLPDVKMKRKELFTGAFVTALLFIIVQYMVGMNAENTKINNAYGAIGSATILLLWVFYSSLVFLFGASFTKVLSQSPSRHNDN
jgi:membrane protein